MDTIDPTQYNDLVGGAKGKKGKKTQKSPGVKAAEHQAAAAALRLQDKVQHRAKMQTARCPPVDLNDTSKFHTKQWKLSQYDQFEAACRGQTELACPPGLSKLNLAKELQKRLKQAGMPEPTAGRGNDKMTLSELIKAEKLNKISRARLETEGRKLA